MRAVDATALSAVCAIVLAAVAAGADAAECSYSDDPRMVEAYGGLELERVILEPDQPRAVVEGLHGAFLVDMTDPSAPDVWWPGHGSPPRQLWGEGFGAFDAHRSCITGDRLYTWGISSGSVRVRDLSDPGGSWPLVGAIEPDGDDLWAAGVASMPGVVAVLWKRAGAPNGPHPLVVYDGTTPLPLVELGRIDLDTPLEFRITPVMASPTILVVPTADGFVVVDLSDPAAPAVTAAVVVDRVAVSAEGSLLAVLQPSGAVQLFDLSVPTAVQPAGQVAGSADVESISISGSHLYVGRAWPDTADGETAVYDISEPSSPTLVGTLPTGPTFGIGVRGDALVVAGGTGGVVTGRLAGPAAVDGPLRGEPARSYRGWIDVGFAHMVEDGHRMYVDGVDEGVWILDTSHPDRLVELGLWPVPGDDWRTLAADGPILYVRDSDVLSIVDTTDPTAPDLVASLPLPATLGPLVADGGVAAVAVDQQIKLVDARDPSSVTFATTLPAAPSHDLALALEGHALVWGDEDTELVHVVDVTDPYAPVETAVIGAADLDPEAADRSRWRFHAAGDGTAYLSFTDVGSYGVIVGVGVILDVTDPAVVVDVVRFPLSTISAIDRKMLGTSVPHHMMPVWQAVGFTDLRDPDLTGWVDASGFWEISVAGYRLFGLDSSTRSRLLVLDFARCDVFEIFADGFDSGDLSAWTTWF